MKWVLKFSFICQASQLLNSWCWGLIMEEKSYFTDRCFFWYTNALRFLKQLTAWIVNLSVRILLELVHHMIYRDIMSWKTRFLYFFSEVRIYLFHNWFITLPFFSHFKVMIASYKSNLLGSFCIIFSELQF